MAVFVYNCFMHKAKVTCEGIFHHILNRVSTYFILLIFIISPMLCQAESLYVFYPATIRPKILERKLSQTCPGIKITVFGRYRDFKISIDQDPPDAILTKTLLISQFSGYNIKYNGIRNGETEEPYVLLSINEKLKTDDFSDTPIGIVDFLGRKNMKSFVRNLLKNSPKLKRVTKIEDLLPLLTFDIAKGILITEKNIAFFKKISNLNLKVTHISGARTGIIALAVKKDQNATSIINAIKKMPVSTIKALGVQNWE